MDAAVLHSIRRLNSKVATEDKSIAPEIQRAMYKRSNTKAMEVKGSHVIYMSQPQAVAKVIEEAAKVK